MKLSIIEAFKLLTPLLSIIASIIGLKSGWVYKRDKLFNSRKTLSEFSYALYKSTSDENFKRISIEYGISAITRDSTLSPEKRRVLLHSKDPVKDIDNYVKCQKLLKIKNEATVFVWAKNRYRYWIWRRSIEMISLILYFVCSFITAIPFIYTTVLSKTLIEKIDKLSTISRLGMASYFVLMGFCLAIFFLHKLSTIVLAEKIIKSNQ